VNPPVLIGSAAGSLAAIIAQAEAPDPTNPTSWFTSLGVAGVVAFVVWLWQRDTAKQRDRLQKSYEELNPILGDVRDAIRQSNDAHRASAEAHKAAADALKHVPSEEVWTRLRVALEYAEDRRVRTDRGEP
jgi:hypothetical protein